VIWCSHVKYGDERALAGVLLKDGDGAVYSTVVSRSTEPRGEIQRGSRLLYSAATVSSRQYSQAVELDQVSSIPWSSRSRTTGGREKGSVLACGAARRYLF
jgi:hypothetical protein